MNITDPPARPVELPQPGGRFPSALAVHDNGAFTDPSMHGLLRRLASRWRVLASVFLGVFTAITAYTLLVTPRYRSEARLRIDSSSPGGMGMAEQMLSAVPAAGILNLGRDELETDIAVLNSDRIRDAVIDSLGLDVQLVEPKEGRAQLFTASVHDPNADADGTITLRREPSGVYRVEPSGFDETPPLPPTLAVGAPLRVGGTVLTLTPNLARGGPSTIELRVLPRFKVHKLLDRRLLIARQEGGSRLVEVSFEDPDRVLAAQVVRRVIAEYVQYVATTDATQDALTLSRIQGEVVSTAGRLATAENALRVFGERSRLVAPEEQASAQVKRISVLSAQIDALSTERNALARMLSAIEQRSRSGADPAAFRQLATFPSLISNKGIQDLLQTLVELENKRSELSVRRTESNEDYRQLTTRIAELERQLYQVGPQYLESLNQQLATAAATVGALKDTLSALPGAAMQYGRLVRDRTLYDATYAALQKQLTGAELASLLRRERVHIVDAPGVPNSRDHVFPNRPVMVVLGAILGVALALTIGLFLELSGAGGRAEPRPAAVS